MKTKAASLIGMFFLCVCLRVNSAFAQDVFDFNCSDRFDPCKPTLVLKYEVAYRLLWLNLMHLADAVVYATDGEWFNEATGEWARAYLMIMQLDTLEEPSRYGRGLHSIHNRLATVLLKPSLEPLIFAKKDFLHVDTLFSKTDVHNEEYFSVESGKNDYIKRDHVSQTTVTNLEQFGQLASQRQEVFRFMRVASALYSGETNNLPANREFTISVYTDNTLVPFNVEIAPRLRGVNNILGRRFKALYFEAVPAPEFSGKGRPLEVWACSFRYLTEKLDDAGLIWLSSNTFEFGMIPLMAQYGLRIGAVHCELAEVQLEADSLGLAPREMPGASRGADEK